VGVIVFLREFVLKKVVNIIALVVVVSLFLWRQYESYSVNKQEQDTLENIEEYLMGDDPKFSITEMRPDRTSLTFEVNVSLDDGNEDLTEFKQSMIGRVCKSEYFKKYLIGDNFIALDLRSYSDNTHGQVRYLEWFKLTNDKCK